MKATSLRKRRRASTRTCSRWCLECPRKLKASPDAQWTRCARWHLDAADPTGNTVQAGAGAEPTGESQKFGELFFYRLVTGVTADGSCVTLKPLFLLASPRGFEPLLPP
jgi:hypothetical protein